MTLAYIDELQIVEVTHLQECEAVIERGIKTFVDVGLALMEIRDNRLYRQDFATFEDYCRDRWGMARRTAYQYLDAALVVENVRNCAQILPTTESQARPLASLAPAQQIQAWKLAVETAPEGKITAAHVQSAVDEVKQIDKPHVANNSGENEWYTPVEYIQAAREVMGEIDLDPASSEVANRTVGATVYFTKQDNGLAYSWDGRAWMNPPYAAELIGKFASKLALHVSAGDITEAIVLVNNATETAWFGALVGVASAIVFPRARVKFLDADGNPGAPLQGQAVIYCGNNPKLFLEKFGKFGWGASICR